MNCWYTNANSLVGKIDEFRYRVQECDIIGVTETWAGQHITDAELAVPGFNMFRGDRRDRQGGGVLLYVRTSMQAIQVESLGSFEESVWCTISTGQEKLLVGICYRSPTSSALNNNRLLLDIREAMRLRGNQHLLLMGDFNYPTVDFSSGTVDSADGSDASRFLEMVEDLFLVQNVTEFTRCRKGQVPSMLDYVFTEEENLVDSMTYEAPLGKSDHVCLRWRLQISKEAADEECLDKLNYWKGDYARISAALAAVDWSLKLDAMEDVNDMWTAFAETLKGLVAKYVPRKRDTVDKRRGKSVWITRETVKSMKERSKAWKTYRDFPSEANYNRYKATRNHVNGLVRRDRDAYQKKMLKSFKDNPKRFYGYMRSVQTRPTGVSQLRDKTGRLTTSDQEAAEVLSSCFQEVYTREDKPYKGVCREYTQYVMTEDAISMDPVTVERALQRLKVEKSPGPDGIHPMVLRECAGVLSVPLSKIFMKSLQTGRVPQEWKLANVTPLFKKGTKSDPSNYRPVSLTSVVCKIMEGLIKEKMVEHLERANSMSGCQHGFVKGRSCLTNLLCTLDSWTRALDEGYGVDVLYLDYRKAFDTVPHKRLILKLRQYGIKGQLLNWIEDFLTLRKSRVRVRGKFSGWKEVLSGVPQGSVLGPLLFLLFVNDLPEWIKSSLVMFADDTKVWTTVGGQRNGEDLQRDLDSLQRWSREWLMRFNADKCVVMHIGNEEDVAYYMEGVNGTEKLKSTREEKDLGIYITRDLKSATQCAKAAAKGMSMIGMIGRHFKRLDKADFLMLYKVYVRPRLEYCVQAWSPYLVKDVECIERVQRRATKMVVGMGHISYEERLRRLGLTTLEQRRKRGDLIEVFKIMTGRERIDSDIFFKRASSGHHLRGHSQKLFAAGARLDVRKHFFSVRVTREWNALPQTVVDAPSVNTFKNRLDKFWKDAGI